VSISIGSIAAVAVAGLAATALVGYDVYLGAQVAQLNQQNQAANAKIQQMQQNLTQKQKEHTRPKPILCYHYSQYPPESFSGGLFPPAWVTPLGNLDSKSAMFGFGIAPPLYQYTFQIDPELLGPPDTRTPGGWPYVQYELLGPTGPGSLIEVQPVLQTHTIQ